MKYVKLEDVQKILSDMNSEVTAVQLPALDRFESAVEELAVYDFPAIYPSVDDLQAMGAHSQKLTCHACYGTGRIMSVSTGYSVECSLCSGEGQL